MKHCSAIFGLELRVSKYKLENYGNFSYGKISYLGREVDINFIGI